jgi:peroxiredoxin
MRAVRHWLIAGAILAFTVQTNAQDTKKADPHKPAEATKPAEPAKPAPAAPKAEPAKPAAPEAKAAPEVKATAAAAPAGAAIGKPAPDFALKDVTGKDVKLADSKGKIVVLVWGNADCPAFGRVAKGKILDKTFAGLKDKNVVWYTIDSSATATADNAKKFAADNAVPGAYLLDPTGATGKAYGAKTTPHAFVIDAKGNLAYMGALDDDAQGGKEKVRNYVTEAVEALVKGSAVATATTDPYGCSVKYKQ